ncbi:serine hydrolase domain-containing protein [Aquiflexum sp.]|uniref:serine hydrolase domain-containing protein n=1 Tax=Aquiflexum sp. TaxID=1872584 RepID=UPI0035938EBF
MENHENAKKHAIELNLKTYYLLLSISIILFKYSTISAQNQSGSHLDKSLQVVLDSARTSMEITGAAACVIFKDSSMWQGVSGLARPGSSVSTNTAFELGSISKIYTATTVLKLVAEGRLNLDDRLYTWFPNLPSSESNTITQLLNHTHGLHDPLQESDFVPAIMGTPTKIWTLDDLLTKMKDPYFEPGAGWHYSNTGFHILGAIIEAVTDSTFSDVLSTQVLKSLKLDNTWYGAHDPVGKELAVAYIDPFGSGDLKPVSLMMPWTAFRTSAGPAGAVVSTASDAAQFLHGLMTGSVLEEAEWNRMTNWVDRPDGYKYGAGLLHIKNEGRFLLGHKGNSAGYSASAFHDQSQGVTIVVLTNAHAVDVTPIVTTLLQISTRIER